MSLSGWLDMNLGIEGDGGNIPVKLQKCMYRMISQGRAPELLPHDDETLSAAPESPPTSPGRNTSVVSEAPDGSKVVQGWACIPRGGLERNQPTYSANGMGIVSQLAHLSENSA